MILGRCRFLTASRCATLLRTIASSSQNANENASHSGTDFPLDTSVFWPRVPSTPDELIDFIKRNVVWVSKNYIASVKPYDISAFGLSGHYYRKLHKRELGLVKEDTPRPFDNWDDGEHEPEPEGGINDPDPVTVAAILPELKREFGGEKLFIAKSVPRFYEGPLLLARNEKANMAAAMAQWRGLCAGKPHTKALYICVGKPRAVAGEGWCNSKVEFINDDEGYQYVLHPRQPSKTAARRQRIIRGFFRYRVLAFDSAADCSLVEMEFMKSKFQLDRLFLLDQGCPVLGDTMNQKCNARVLGQPVYVPRKKASIQNQYIPVGLLKKLRISLKEYHSLPMFAHIHSVSLFGLLGKRKKTKDVELRAPMPSYFVEVLRVFDWLRVVEEDEKRRQHEEKEQRQNADAS